MLNCSVIEITEQRQFAMTHACEGGLVFFLVWCYPKIYSRCTATVCVFVRVCCVRDLLWAGNLHGSRAMK